MVDYGLTPMEALIAGTRNAADNIGLLADLGTIEPGKLADLVLVSDDLLKVDPRAIRDAKVEMTMVDGKIVYGGPPQ